MSEVFMYVALAVVLAIVIGGSLGVAAARIAVKRGYDPYGRQRVANSDENKTRDEYVAERMEFLERLKQANKESEEKAWEKVSNNPYARMIPSLLGGCYPSPDCHGRHCFVCAGHHEQSGQYCGTCTRDRFDDVERDAKIRGWSKDHEDRRYFPLDHEDSSTAKPDTDEKLAIAVSERDKAVEDRE